MDNSPNSGNLNNSVLKLIRNPLAKGLLYIMLERSSTQHTYKSRQEGFQICANALRREGVIQWESYGGNPPEFHFRGQLTPNYLPNGKYHKKLTELCAEAKDIENIECL